MGNSKNARKKKKWELVVADRLDHETAGRLGDFISSFPDPDLIASGGVCYKAEYFLWKINGSPHGNGFVSLAVDKGKIVGTIAFYRRKVWFRGQWINGAEIGDGFINPDYQGLGIFTKLIKSTIGRALKEGVQIIYATPNYQTLPIFEKHCSIYRKNGLDMFLWALPLKPGSIISTTTTRRIPSFAKSIANWTTDKLMGTISAIMSDGCKVEQLDFNADFDALDEILRQKYSFMLSKKAEDLKYRIADNPEANRYGIITRRSNDQLKGVLVFKDTIKRGLKTLFIADCYGCDRSSLVKLWHAAILHSLKEKYELIVTGTILNIHSVFSMLPIIPIPTTRKDVIFHDKGIGGEALRDSGRWHFSILDTDNI